MNDADAVLIIVSIYGILFLCSKFAVFILLLVIFTESEENKGDFQPIMAEYGECIEWNASFLTHGNKINRTDITRVSFDFRVIPRSLSASGAMFSAPTKTP